jgi:hypothetical protein
MEILRQRINESRRDKVIMTPEGKYEVEQIIPSTDFPVNDAHPFTYKCDWESLMSINEALLENRDDTAAMSHLIYSEPNIIYAKRDNPKDKTGSLLSQLEAAVLRNDDIDGLVNPSRGTFVRAKKAGITECDVYLTRDRDNQLVSETACRGAESLCAYNCRLFAGNEFKCKDCGHSVDVHDRKVTASTTEEYATVVKNWASTSGIIPRIKQYYRRDLPRKKKLYVGLEGSIMPGGTNWVGIEYNPYVANVLSLGLLEATDLDDGYSIKYQRKMYPYWFKYKYTHPGYREHGFSYLQRVGCTATMHHSAYNVVYGNFRPLTTYVCKTAKSVYSHSPHRLVTCVGVRHVDINYSYISNGVRKETSVTCDVCEHDDVVDIVSPAYELSTRIRILKDMQLRPCQRFENKFRVASSYIPRFMNFEDDAPAPVYYKIAESNVPTAWMFFGEWKLRAFPEAMLIEGRWRLPPFAEDLKIPAICDDMLFVRLQNNYYYKSGFITQVWYPSGIGGEKMYVNDRPRSVTQTSVTTKVVDQTRPHRMAYGFAVYDCASPDQAEFLLKLFGSGVLGDISRYIECSSPANATTMLTRIPVDESSMCRINLRLNDIKLVPEIQSYTQSRAEMSTLMMLEELDDQSSLVDINDEFNRCEEL